MSEIRRLEQEINILQAQLRQQNVDAEKVRQNLIEENRRNLQAYQTDMRRAISDHDSNTRAEYERLLRQYQDLISNDIQNELAKTNADYSKLLNDVKHSEALLIKKNQELEQEIAKIKNDFRMRNEGNSQEAKIYLKSAINVFNKIKIMPHEKFMPKRLQIFFNAIKDGQQLFKAGLFEAAIAVAISSKSGLERLGYIIDDKVEEWDKQFDLFCLRLSYLKIKIQQELTDWEEFINNKSEGDLSKRTRNLIEINYWSKGEFSQVVQTVKRYQKVFSAYTKLGKNDYLKQLDSPSINDLKHYIFEIESADKRLSEFSDLYKQRYLASCERYKWGEAIIDFLTTEINLDWLEELTGYEKANPEVLVSKDFIDYIKNQFGTQDIDEDIREWLKIVFKNSSENQIYVYILPFEAEGKVINRIVLHIDYGGPEQQLYSKEIYKHICEAIQITDENGDIVNYAEDITALKISENKVYSKTAKDIEQMKYKNGH